MQRPGVVSAKPRVERESSIVRSILFNFGNDTRLRLWRQNTGAARIKGRLIRFGHPGQADISGILANGRRLEIECKSKTGRLSAPQVAFKAMIEAYGGLHIVARDVGDVDAVLERECK